jgi:hypothetical protein
VPQRLAQFGERDIRRLRDPRQQEGGFGLDAIRPAISALGPRPVRPLARHSAIQWIALDTPRLPEPEILGQASRHACCPPCPAHILNQNRQTSGIPDDSHGSEIALDVWSRNEMVGMMSEALWL